MQNIEKGLNTATGSNLSRKKKKLLVIIIASVLAAAILATVIITVIVSNKNDKKFYNNETDYLIFSTLDLEKVFNPFFSTAATDSNVVGMTQISMLSNTANGQIAFGEKEGVVALDYQEVITGTPEVDLQTTYYFVLKNNIKFSDGTPLTMKDVLFNLYVYLDPNYTGSATMYSTDIVGLKAYRTNATDKNEQEGFREQFDITARQRISDLSYAAQEILDDHPGGITKEAFRDVLAENPNGDLVNDYDKALEYFREELESDYANSLNTYQDVKFKKEGEDTKIVPFTTDVEVFFYNEGYITWNKKEGKLEDTITQNNQTAELKSWTKEEAISYVYEDKIPKKIVEIINYWVTSTNLQTYISNAEMEKYFLNLSDKDNQFSHIEGIKFANRTESVIVNDVTYSAIGSNYNADGSVKDGYNEVLSITINNVDPKAKWNFAFSVAPLHYYSNSEQIAKFDYENHFGVEKGSQTFMETVIKGPDKIGLPLGAGPYAASKSAGGINSIDNPNVVTAEQFFDESNVYYQSNPYYILGEPKIKNLRFAVVSSNGMLNALYNGEIDFAEPSAKPELVDEIKNKGYESESIRTSGYGYIGVNAGKVPSINVRQAIMHAINTQLCVEYYKSTASAIYRPISTTSWAYPEDATPYYPFIGGPIPKNVASLKENEINPAYQRYIAYIKSNNIQTYSYANGLVPYSGSGDEYLGIEEQKQFIKWLVEENEIVVDAEHVTTYNYALNADGVYTSNTGFMAARTLKYTFTVAGEETDHPAWSAMANAENFLDKCGFDITTKTDANALTKLATGSLTVWAAAWGSTIDPDMYQVYHKDSAATSTLNWGYREIKNNPDRYAYESEIIEVLSLKIEQGREKLEDDDRIPIYHEALDLVMKLAVELPTYQRDDLFAYNQNKIDAGTLNQNPTAYKGLTSDIHTVSLITER